MFKSPFHQTAHCAPVFRPHKTVACGLLLLCFNLAGLSPVSGATVDDFLALSYTNAPSQVLPYRLWVPRNMIPGVKYPLVVFLHGAGERGTDNRNQLSVNPAPMVFVAPQNQANWPCFMIAPQCPAGQTWAGMTQGDRWGDTDGTGDFTAESPWTLNAVMAILGQMTNAGSYAPQIDVGRLYITGLSMGGYGSWEAICRWPGVFKAAAPICGGGDPTRVGVITKTPVWAFHAANDTTVPVVRSRQMIQALGALGIMTRFTEYPTSMGIGHAAWVPAYADPDLLPWLFGKTAEQGGDGVLAEYYANTNLTGTPVIRQVERAFDLDWESASPGTGLPADGFSVRLSARLLVEHPGSYSFQLAADDRASLSIDGQACIVASGLMTNPVTTSLELTSGLHHVEMIFTDLQGRAWVRLAWASNSMPFKPLLQEDLFCPASRVAPLALSPQPGFYGINQSIGITSATPDVVIRYTTNGVPPTSSSSQYSTPIPVSSPLLVRAVGFKSGVLDSALLCGDYFVSVPTFTSVPQSRAVVAGTDIVLSASATGIGPLRYQWLWNGMPVIGQTNTSYSITNPQPVQSGAYQVQVADNIGTNISPVAQITIAFKPYFTIQQPGLVVLEGQPVLFTVAAEGSLPLSFRWRKGAITLTNMILNTNLCRFSIPQAQLSNSATYTVILTNAVGSTISSNIVLSVLNDFDRDGMADAWETQYGFSTNNAQDAVADLDLDGFPNRSEYAAGTDPSKPDSYFQLRAQPTGASEYRLEFLAVSNRSYALQYAESLTNNLWMNLTNYTARASNRVEVFVAPLEGASGFYRLAIPQ